MKDDQWRADWKGKEKKRRKKQEEKIKPSCSLKSKGIDAVQW